MALTVEAVRAFLADKIQFYTTKRFYAIFPNGTKVPLTSVSDAVESAELRPLKTMGDRDVEARLVLVVEATNQNADGSESIYWRQAFYYSTGTSSGAPSTWLPFDGIVLGSPEDDYMSNKTIAEVDPVPGTQPPIEFAIWFDKSPFVLGYRPALRMPDPSIPPIITAVDGMYGKPGFLPESLYRERFGSTSHAIASYILGGTAWEVSGGPRIRDTVLEVKPEDIGALDIIEFAFSEGRGPNPKFDLLAQRHDILPYSKIQDITNYISTYKAVSYMSPFWGTGVEDQILMPKSFEVPAFFSGTQYNIPYYYFVNPYRSSLRKLLIDIRTGAVPADPATLLDKIQREAVRDTLFKTRADGNVVNLVDQLGKYVLVITPLQAPIAHAFGGRRNKKRKTVRRKARKGKSYRKRSYAPLR